MVVAVLFLGLTWRASAAPDDAPPVGPFAGAIQIASQRVVKIYGAAVGTAHGYGSGVLVSADGKIVTASALLLEARTVRAVLPDGRAFPAKIIARDEGRQLALLKIEATDLPFFRIGDSRALRVGDWTIAAANAFKVADGPEPVSVSVGVLTARATMAARARAQDFPYDGPVLLADTIVANPGCAGGALVDLDGNLVGVIGKAVLGERTNTWMNYALPAEEVAAFLEGKPRALRHETAKPPETEKSARPDLGIRLLDVGGRKRPAYIERVRPGSPAAQAGVQANDLVLSIDGRRVATCEDYRAVFETLRPEQQIEMSVKRGNELVTIHLTVGRDAP